MGDGLIDKWIDRVNQTEAPKLFSVIESPDAGYEISQFEGLSEQAIMYVHRNRSFDAAIIPHSVLKEIGVGPDENTSYYDPNAISDVMDQNFQDVRVNALRLLKSLSDNTDLKVNHDFAGLDIEQMSPVIGSINKAFVKSLLIEDLQGILNQQGNLESYSELPDIMPDVENMVGEVSVAFELANHGAAIDAGHTLLNHSSLEKFEPQRPNYTPGPSEG